MFETVGKNPQRQTLEPLAIASSSVRPWPTPWKLHDLGQPATIFFLFILDINFITRLQLTMCHAASSFRLRTIFAVPSRFRSHSTRADGFLQACSRPGLGQHETVPRASPLDDLSARFG